MSLETNGQYAGVILLALDDHDKKQYRNYPQGVLLALKNSHAYYCMFCQKFSSNSESRMSEHMIECTKAPRQFKKTAKKALAKIMDKTKRCFCGRPAESVGVGLCKFHKNEANRITRDAHTPKETFTITGQGAIQ